MPMIMAHCHYSLRAGEKLTFRYDFQALEKEFLNEFVYGKPRIEVKELPHMVYRKDVYTAQKFEEIERNVSQVSTYSLVSTFIIEATIQVSSFFLCNNSATGSTDSRYKEKNSHTSEGDPPVEGSPGSY